VDTSITKLRTRRKHQTRAEIIRVAFELFGKSGYEEVSMDSIAAAAGVSRATLFNYFPQKELILREIAAARVEKLKSILAEFGVSGHAASFEDIVDLMVRISEENARISGHSKKLLLETIFRQASQGLLLAAREQAVEALATSIARTQSQSQGPTMEPPKKARLAAETVFAVYMATMLEWLMREGVPQQWLADTMRQRLLVLKEGVV
jgi:AcrR family transcriptional regulator